MSPNTRTLMGSTCAGHPPMRPGLCLPPMLSPGVPVCFPSHAPQSPREDNFPLLKLHYIKSALQLEIVFIWGPLIKNTTKSVDNIR